MNRAVFAFLQPKRCYTIEMLYQRYFILNTVINESPRLLKSTYILIIQKLSFSKSGYLFSLYHVDINILFTIDFAGTVCNIHSFLLLLWLMTLKKGLTFQISSSSYILISRVLAILDFFVDILIDQCIYNHLSGLGQFWVGLEAKSLQGCCFGMNPIFMISR